MLAERLKGPRALRLVPNPKQKAMNAVSDHPERDDADHQSGEMRAAQRITEPASARPDGDESLEVTIPPLPALPTDLLTRLEKLPPANPDSYLEVALEFLIRNAQTYPQQQERERALMAAEFDRVDRRAEERSATRTKELTGTIDRFSKNQEIANHFAQELGKSLGLLSGQVTDLSTQLTEVSAQVGKLEQASRATKTQFSRHKSLIDGLRDEIRSTRADMDRKIERLEAALEDAVQKMQGTNGTNPPSRPTRKTNPG